MKKQLLFTLAVGIGFCAIAQTRQNSQPLKPNNKFLNDPESGSFVAKPRPSSFSGSRAIGCTPLGTSANAIGLSGGARTALTADPALNTIVLTHRASTSPGSGYLQFDKSTDGGATFTTNTTMYSPSGANARYPQGLIYNPAGNTDPNNAYVTYFAPGQDASNGATWGAYVYGVEKLNGTGATQNVLPSNSSQMQYIPDAMTVTQGANPTVFVVDAEYDVSSGSLVYQGNIIIGKGTFTGTDISYTFTKLPVPVSLDNTGASVGIAAYNIAFGPDGQTGYIGLLTHLDYTARPDSSFYPVFYKTTDAGTTWSGPYSVNIDNVYSLLGGASGDFYTTAFELDMAVDVNNDLHMTMAIGPSSNGWSIYTTPGIWGLFDVYTYGSPLVTKAKLLITPQTFRGTFGALSEDSRPQISRTVAGDKLFFSWFDTDTATFGAGDNAYPDLFTMAADITSANLWTSPVNKTVGTCADGAVTFGSVSPLVFGTSGTYTIPVAYQQILTDDASPVQLQYLQGVQITDAAFTDPGNAILLSSTVGIDEDATNSLVSAVIYPNPVSSSASLNITLNKAATVSVGVYNSLGQIVIMNKSETLSAGAHTITLDAGTLESGLYFYTVRTGDFCVTKKMVVRK
ncbi:MAG: BNR/Asp-box repeat protein [Bacteroidota bacterium]|jgi:hypothetical protein|nr:BNR/Asp-box repeat protein [Bacteroidota bacterium]